MLKSHVGLNTDIFSCCIFYLVICRDVFYKWADFYWLSAFCCKHTHWWKHLSDSSTILPSPEGQLEIDFTTVLIPVSALTISDSLVNVSLRNLSSNSLKLLPFSFIRDHHHTDTFSPSNQFLTDESPSYVYVWFLWKYITSQIYVNLMSLDFKTTIPVTFSLFFPI